MRRFGTTAFAFAATLTIFSGASVLAADKAAPASANAPGRMEMTDDGLIMVTPAGMTLYVNGADATKPGTSQCTDKVTKARRDGQGEFGMVPFIRPDTVKSCVQTTPPYIADANAQPVGDYGFIERTDGLGKQWTWQGKPLYLSAKDLKPGDRYGSQGIAGGGGGRGRGLAFASPPLEFPGGLKLTRLDDDLVLATDNGRPVYAPKGRLAACQGCEEVFQPIGAPAIAEVSGDWSVVDAGAGRKQYAFRGKPLYAAPISMNNIEIADAGAWEPVAYRNGPGIPSVLGKHMTLMGEVYTDKSGKTLYTFSCGGCDAPGDPAGYWVAVCGMECDKRWHPYLAAADAKAVGDWQVVDVAQPIFTDPRGLTYPAESPRVKAWAYRGKPLFTYYEDKVPGEIWGHRINGEGGGFNAMQVAGRGTD